MLGFFTISRAERRLIPDTRLAGPMPWVIAIMIFLTILAVAAGLSLRSGAQAINAQLSGRVTIQILAVKPQERAKQLTKVEQALDASALVARRNTLSQEELEALLAPWLGGDVLDDTITIPAMIDVDLKGAASAKASPDARLDPHGRWLQPVFDLLVTLQLLALVLVIMLGAATAAIVVLTVRGALNTHGPTIAVMHLLGSTDIQVARLFQRRVALDAFFGSMLGSGLAALALYLLSRQIGGLDAGLLNSGQLNILDLALLVLVPLSGIILATIVARATVIIALRKSL
jgi:cell division transport system permease protein